jgi:hypothetical protein
MATSSRRGSSRATHGSLLISQIVATVVQ